MRFITLIIFSALLFSLLGCKLRGHSAITAPTTQPAQETDATLLQRTQRDGVGIALRIPGPLTFHAGQPIPLHIALEDFSARAPIASGPCLTLNLNTVNVATQQTTLSALTLPACEQVQTDQIYGTPLQPSQPVSFDVTSANAFDEKIQPGKYRVSIGWSVYQAGDYGLFTRRQYGTALSNEVLLQVIP